MSPANGHANDSANIPTTAVQQFAPPASDVNIPTALTPTATKIKELIANLEVPFHPSVIEWRVTNTSKGGSPRGPDDDNAATAAEAQSFKRACCCFGLGRYLYYFTGTWVDLDDRKRPKTVPKLDGWATPEGWRRGLRPHAEEDSKPAERTTAGTAGNGDSHRNGNGASDQDGSLVREIEQMERALGKRMYRGLLKTLAREWNPKDIQDPAIQQKVLAHMQAAERGFRRLDAALERVGPEALTQILRSLKLQSLDLVDNLQTLREIVLALEAAAVGKAVKQ